MTFALQFRGVTKTYARSGFQRGTLREVLSGPVTDLFRRQVSSRPALNDVSFDVPEGASFAIMGPNGAGKTTALKLASRISPPTRGEIRVRGRLGALIEVGAGIHPELTGRENIWFYGQLLGLQRSQIGALFDEIVAFAELESVIDRPLKTFSTGMQLRLGFAVASHLNPDVLIVDEALAVGDAGFQAKCMQRMTDLLTEGGTLVFVSHSVPLVRHLCRTGVLLDEGRIQLDGTADEVINGYLDLTASKGEQWRNTSDSVAVGDLRVTGHLPKQQVGTDEGVTIELELYAQGDVSDAVIGIGISDGRPGNLINMSMLSQGRFAHLAAGRSRLECRVPQLPLLPGTYEIWFSVVGRDRPVYYSHPCIVGSLVVTKGPKEGRQDLGISGAIGFGPVHVPFDLAVTELPSEGRDLDRQA